MVENKDDADNSWTNMANLHVSEAQVRNSSGDDDSVDDTTARTSRTTTGGHNRERRPAAERLREKQEQEQDIHTASNAKERSQNFINALPRDKYEVIRPLGSGHSGSVYAVKQFLLSSSNNKSEAGEHETEERSESERMVAIKFLQSTHGGYIDRRTREFTAHRLLPPHENIVQLISNDMVSVGGYEYFVMELCDMSLETWIQNKAEIRKQQQQQDRREVVERRPALDPMATVELLYDLFAVLVILRQLGITHRDIRPANLLLKRNCRPSSNNNKSSSKFPYQVKLADFGISDIQVIPEASHYTNYFGVSNKPAQDVSYDFDDDFRAVVASVFVAWVGEAMNDDDARSAFRNQQAFEDIISSFAMSMEDEELSEFFERALPMPRMVRKNEVYNFEKAIEELEEMGKELSGKEDWMKTKIKIPESTDGDETLHNDKVDAYVNSSLSVISGRRWANDYATAERYLRWAERLIGRFEGTAPNDIMIQFHLQWGLILCLKPLTNRVSEFVKARTKAEMEGLTTTSSLEETQNEIKRIKASVDNRVDLIKIYSKDQSFVGKLSPGLMLQTLGTVEIVKYYQACGLFDEALRLSETHVKGLLETLSRLEDEEATPGLTSTDIRHRYQICRNTYLMIRETIVLSQRGDLMAQRNDVYYKEAAVDICRKGHRFVRIDVGSNNSDRLEAGRCLCEALFILESYNESREVCRELYNEFVHDTTQKVRLLRVVAIWVACLRILSQQGSTELMFEFGYVCSILTTTNREAADQLFKQDKRSLSNAEQFLAPTTIAAVEAGSDQLMECPVLPSAVELVCDDARRALDALRAASKK